MTLARMPWDLALPQRHTFRTRIRRNQIGLAKFVTFLYILPFFVGGVFIRTQNNIYEVSRQSGDIGNYVFIAVWIVAATTILLAFLIRRTRNIANIFIAPFICLIALFALEIISAGWSSVPSGSLYHAAPNTLSLIYVAFITSVLNTSESAPEELYLLWCFTVRVLGCLLLLLLVSALTDENGFRSAYGEAYSRLYGGWWFGIHPNVSGFIATICILHFLVMSRKLHVFDLVLLAASGAVFILSRDRTQYVTLFVALLMLSLYQTKARRYFVAGALSLSIIALTQYDLLLHFLSRGGNLQSLTSLTGRASVWSAAIEFALSKFWLGWGAWSGAAVDYNFRYAALFPYRIFSNIDNAFLQVFVDCGIGGLILFCLYTTLSLWNSFHFVRYGGIQKMAFFANLVIFLKAITGVVVVSFDATQIVAMFAILVGITNRYSIRSKLIGKRRANYGGSNLALLGGLDSGHGGTIVKSRS